MSAHMSRVLTYATVCSGIECMSVAASGLPLRPVFFSEIEPFPCALLRARYPHTPNLGDMSRIAVSNNGLDITNGTTRLHIDSRLDILAGGTPCQDVSIAGKRAGMAEGSGTRSSLAFEFVRLARELRPEWVLWENVAGCIDSKNAPDFLRFASALGECGYACCWRVLDAQHVRVDGVERAVPQRRRRVWVVGHLGADVARASEILFEPDSVVGDSAPRRRAGEGFAYSLARCDRVDARLVGEPGVMCFQEREGKPGGGWALCYDGYNQRGYEEVSMTMRSAMTGTEGNDADPKVAYGINPQGGQMMPFDHETGETLALGHGGGVCEVVGFKAGQSMAGRLGDEREVAPTLSHQPSGLEPTAAIASDIAAMRYIVRRLTPLECERLMGLPDGYTVPVGLDPFDPYLVADFIDIFEAFARLTAKEGDAPPKRKSAKTVSAWLAKIADPATCPDSPRYKGCGNGWATNCPRWILTRILHRSGINPFGDYPMNETEIIDIGPWRLLRPDTATAAKPPKGAAK